MVVYRVGELIPHGDLDPLNVAKLCKIAEEAAVVTGVITSEQALAALIDGYKSFRETHRRFLELID